jgi:hypothetical protein
MKNGGHAPLANFCLALAVAGTGAAALSGCADIRRSLETPAINVESPVAAQVRAAAPLAYVSPRLGDVPPIPRNVPQPDVVKTGVLAMVRCRRSVASFAPNHPALTAGAEQFAVNEREIAQINPADVPPSDSATKSDAEASELRAYASPPSAIASGPAPSPEEAKPNAPAPAPASRRSPAARHPTPAPVPSAQTASASAVGSAAVPSSSGATPAGAPVRSAVASPAGAQPGAGPPLPVAAPDPYLARCL